MTIQEQEIAHDHDSISFSSPTHKHFDNELE